MARLPKDAGEAVGLLGVEKNATVLALGPAAGFVEALAEAVGTQGKVIVRDPPPDLTSRKKAVNIVDDLADDTVGNPMIVWVGTVGVPQLRDMTRHVADGGALWVVLPKGGRDFRAPVSEGDVKRVLVAAGWRETRQVALSTEAYAVRFHPRR